MIATARRAPWWTYLLASLFVATLLFNARQEVFGPGPSGLLYAGVGVDERPLIVEAVIPGSPADRADLLPGDVILTIDGRAVESQTDWFAARSRFERGRSIPIVVQRADVETHAAMTITEANWRDLPSGDVGFQFARPMVLAIALLVAYGRPYAAWARLLALMLAMVSVAEAFPPAGWAGALSHLPPFLALPILWASTSWLVITVPWVAFVVSFPRRLATRRWHRSVIIAPAVVFVPLMFLSSVAFIYQPSVLAMPSAFLDTGFEHLVHGVWGAMPGLIINAWPFYRPARHTELLELWVASSLSFWLAGGVVVIVRSFQEVDPRARTELRVLGYGTAAVCLLGIHNVLTRWGVLGRTGLMIEAGVFVVMLASATIYMQRRRPVDGTRL